MKTSIIVFMLICLSLPSIAQKRSTPKNATPGSCYALCFIGDEKPKWQEIVCREDLTKAFIKKVNNQLVVLGYLTPNEKDNNTINQGLWDALHAYQKDNELPLGSFNIKTVKALKKDSKKLLKKQKKNS